MVNRFYDRELSFEDAAFLSFYHLLKEPSVFLNWSGVDVPTWSAGASRVSLDFFV